MLINLNIQKIMDEKHLTVHDIASKMSISQRTIYRTIQAKRCPTLIDMIEFSRILNVPIEELFTIEEDYRNIYGKNIIR